MKKNLLWFITVGLVLGITSLGLYLVHYAIFHDAHHIFIYLLGDLAFLPLDVFIVGLVIDKILSRRQMAEKRRKMNMVIGTFFWEAGNRLLRKLKEHSPGFQSVSGGMMVSPQWGPADYSRAVHQARETHLPVSLGSGGLKELKACLEEWRPFLLGLLENPNLLEHERFTDLLWAVFHLNEELVSRQDLEGLPQSDIKHLEADAARALHLLLTEWLLYMQHLHQSYPYLFSHAVRISPLLDEAAPVIEEAPMHIKSDEQGATIL